MEVIELNKLYEVRAFLPASVSEAVGSPLTGVDAVFFRIRSTSPFKAAENFFSRKYIQLDVPLPNKNSDEIFFINPSTCSGLIVYPVLTQENESNLPELKPNIAQLRRVK